MVRIRLRRTGKTKQPSYRVVIADSRSPRDGKFIEIIGHYSPTRQPKVLEIKGDRARYWLSVGAQPSETVTKLLKRTNVLDGEGTVIPAEEAEAMAAAAPVVETKPTPAAMPAPAPVAATPINAVEDDEVAVAEDSAAVALDEDVVVEDSAAVALDEDVVVEDSAAVALEEDVVVEDSAAATPATMDEETEETQTTA